MSTRRAGHSGARRWLVLLLGLCALALGALLAWPLLRQNTTQLARLHGAAGAAELQQLLAAAPDDAHLRWQTAAALAAEGDAAAAVETLLPSARAGTLNAPAALLLMESLVTTGQDTALLDLYAELDPRPALSQRASAGLTLALLRRDGALPTDAAPLLARALAYEPADPGFELLTDQMGETSFWSAAAGERVLAALAARAAPPAAAPEAPAPGDPAFTVASLLSLDPQTVQPGRELATNGDFERSVACALSAAPCPVEHWPVARMSTGSPWNRGVFATDLDRTTFFSGTAALRIDGLLLETRPGLEPARAGFWHDPIAVSPGRAYLLSFVYRTETAAEGSAAFWLTSDPGIGPAEDYRLPATDGAWRRVSLLFWHQGTTPTTVQPLLRLWDTGTVWFDALSLRELSLPAKVAPASPQLQISAP